MSNPSMNDLLVVQLATETTWGTPIANQTVRLMGVTDITHQPIAKRKRLKDRRGSLAPSHKAIPTEFGHKGNIKGWLSYEDAVYYLESLFGIVTPTGAGPYVRAYSAPSTALALSGASRARFYSLYYGESGVVFRASGLIFTKLTLNVERDAEVTFEAEFLAKDWKKTGTLTALSNRAVTPVHAADFDFYVDNAGSAAGTTAVADLFNSIKVVIDAKRNLRRHLGNRFATTVAQPKWDGDLTVGMDYDTSFADSYMSSALDETAVVSKTIRVDAVNGTNELKIDFVGTLEESPDTFGDDDGAAVVEWAFKPIVDTVSVGNWLAVTLTNSDSAVA